MMPSRYQLAFEALGNTHPPKWELVLRYVDYSQLLKSIINPGI